MDSPAPLPTRTPRPASSAPASRLAALLLLALCACLHPRGTAERPAILEFQVEGAEALSADELRDHLATEESGTWVWQDAHYLDRDALSNDLRRIVRYYQAHGYYDAKVLSSDVVPVDPDEPGRVNVKVRLAEGVPVRVATIETPGLESAPEAREKLGKLPLEVGAVFTEQAFDATREAILSALTTSGWAKAEVAQHAQVDPAQRQAHVRYQVTTGDRYRFGNVFVAGAAVVPRARIREEAELVATPGTTYDSSSLGKVQARVFDLGVFGGVRVGAGDPDQGRDTVPLVVSVREAPFRTVRAGPGFLIQADRYELDGLAGWSHRNWFGGLRKLNLDLRAGYAWRFNPDKQGVVGLLSADFTQPGILTRNIDLNLRAELERGLEPAYDFWAQRFRVGTPIKFGRTLTIIPSLNLELYEITGAVSGQNPATGSTLLLQTCPGRDPSFCVLSYFEQRIVLDLRDDPILTTQGLYASIALQEGFSVSGNGSSYLRVLPELRAFMSLPLRMVLAGRARLGLAQPLAGGDVPLVAKFTSGGPNLMRGYYTRGLSPVISVVTGGSAQFIPVGGNGLIDGSVELRFPIAGKLSGATFLDFGNVTNTVEEALNVANLQYAAGAGLRYMTIFGPVRVDVAARLPKPGTGMPGVQVQQLGAPLNDPANVTGVHHQPIVSVHLSIGEAF